MRTIRKACLLAIVSLAGAALSGCGTAWNLAYGVDTGAQVTAEWVGLGAETRIYGGLQVDAQAIHKACIYPEGWFHHYVVWFLFVLDFPLSFAADTITLPITIPIVLSREPKK
jgi:uncharacterized protein YceK